MDEVAPARLFAIVPTALWRAGNGTPVLVYCALADHLRGEDREVFPKLVRLGALLGGMPRRTLLRALRFLEDGGFIVRTKGGGKGNPTSYFLPRTVPPMAPLPSSPSAPERVPPMAPVAGERVPPMAPLATPKSATHGTGWVPPMAPPYDNGNERKEREGGPAPSAPRSLFDSTTDTDPDHSPLPKPTTDRLPKQGAGSKVNRTGKAKPTTPKPDSLGWNPLAVFDQLHLDALGRRAPIPTKASKEAAILADVAKRPGIDGNRPNFEKVVRAYLTSSDPWIRDRLGYSISGLPSVLPRLLLEVAPKANHSATDEAIDRAFDAARKLKERAPVHA